MGLIKFDSSGPTWNGSCYRSPSILPVNLSDMFYRSWLVASILVRGRLDQPTFNDRHRATIDSQQTTQLHIFTSIVIRDPDLFHHPLARSTNPIITNLSRQYAVRGYHFYAPTSEYTATASNIYFGSEIYRYFPRSPPQRSFQTCPYCRCSSLYSTNCRQDNFWRQTMGRSGNGIGPA